MKSHCESAIWRYLKHFFTSIARDVTLVRLANYGWYILQFTNFKVKNRKLLNVTILGLVWLLSLFLKWARLCLRVSESLIELWLDF